MSAKSATMFKGLSKNPILKQFDRLNAIAGTSQTAYKIPQQYKEFKLIFSQTPNYNHIGIKKFWKNNLPTLYFHNPEKAFVVTRVLAETAEEKDRCPCKIVITDVEGKTEELDCRTKHSESILAELVQKLNLEPVEEKDIPHFDHYDYLKEASKRV